MESNIHLNEDGRVMISGFYNKDPKPKENIKFSISFGNSIAKGGLIDGAFLSYWDIESGEPSHINFDEFSEDFKRSYWSERKVAKYEKEQAKNKGKFKIGMSGFDLDHVIEKKDGGALLVEEDPEKSDEPHQCRVGLRTCLDQR